ncbi:MAG: hypothetical protein KAR20_00610 [Candidatus Heimdallarchaeota archaeon]|nr:hypothetical protein [Candidatus Heimdallarchaeota archaeon]
MENACVWKYNYCPNCGKKPEDHQEDHEKPEIKPKEDGELWKWCHEYYHTEVRGGLCFYGRTLNVDVKKVIHGKDGWIRVFPDVPDEKEKL